MTQPSSDSNLSYWAKSIDPSFVFKADKAHRKTQYDLVIIGAGITGLCAAYFFQKKRTGSRILVIDKGLLPAGATLNSGGIACIGSISELLALESKESTEDMLELTKRRFNGLSLIRSLVDLKQIQFEQRGNIELFSYGEEEQFKKATENIHRLNGLFESQLGEPKAYSIYDSRIGAGAILNRLEGSFHPGKLLKYFNDILLSDGVEVIHGMKATKIQKGSVQMKDSSNCEYTIGAKNILVATNAFASQLLPELSDIKPGRGQVILTSPFTELAIDLPIHMRDGYDYARPVRDDQDQIRLLLGGGRDLFKREEETFEFGSTPAINNHLRAILEEILLPNLKIGIDYKIDMSWSGIMGFGPNAKPVVSELSAGVYCAVGFGGMGLALGPLVGKEVADRLLAS